MKQYVIGTILEQGIITSNDKGDPHTIFLNPNEKRKKEIRETPLPLEINLDFGWPKDPVWKIDSYEGNEVKCVEGRNVKYINKEEALERQEDAWKQKIEKTYNAQMDFFDIYGTIYLIGWDKSVYKSYYKDIMETIDYSSCKNEEEIKQMKERAKMIRNDSMFEVHFEYDQPDNFKELYDHDLSLKYSEHWKTFFINYDKEGNFVNRDYNTKIQDYTQEKIPFQTVYDRFKKFILSFGEVGYTEKGNKFFIKDYCMEPYIGHEWRTDTDNPLEFYITFHPRLQGSEGVYKRHRNPSIKRPKNLLFMKSKNFLELLENKYLGEILRKIQEEDSKD